MAYTYVDVTVPENTPMDYVPQGFKSLHEFGHIWIGIAGGEFEPEDLMDELAKALGKFTEVPGLYMRVDYVDDNFEREILTIDDGEVTYEKSFIMEYPIKKDNRFASYL